MWKEKLGNYLIDVSKYVLTGIVIREPLKTLFSRHCERSEAIQNIEFQWIASGYRPRNDV